MGVLAAIASNIATTETNIEHVAVDERDGDASTLIFDLQVRDRKHLAHVIKNLRKMPEVLRVTRMLALTAGRFIRASTAVLPIRLPQDSPCPARSSPPRTLRRPSAPIRRPSKCGNTVYVSGQIPLDPATGELVQGPMEAQIRRVFDNLKAIVGAAGGDFSQVAKVNVFLTDLAQFRAAQQDHGRVLQRAVSGARRRRRRRAAEGRAVEMDCVVELE